MNYSWELSPFDTEILGLKTAKIVHVDLKHITDLLKEFRKENIAYATYRIAVNNYPLIHSLEENGFVLVDGLFTLEINLDDGEADLPFIRAAVQEDEKQLIDLARSIFRGVSRYYHDPVIAIKTADRIYQEWMKNSLDKKVADAVLVWKENGSISGFITLQKKGQIPLVGVSESARGKGVGKGLIRAALATFRIWGLKNIRIETQITNLAALRLYHSSGFKLIDASLTFRWIVSS